MDFAMKRLQMLGDLRLSGIVDERVLEAMRQVPRESFIPVGKRNQAYVAVPIAIGYGATLPSATLSAQILQALRLTGAERVLEIGTGSGYQAALLGHLAHTVHTIEVQPALATAAQARLQALGLAKVHVHAPAGSMGWPAAAPYDAIVVAAAVPFLPAELLEQLRPAGRLIVPVGSRSQQSLLLLRQSQGQWRADQLGTCSVVPLSGQGGWPDRPMQEAPRPWF